jgi:hypothetical protein
MEVVGLLLEEPEAEVEVERQRCAFGLDMLMMRHYLVVFSVRGGV